MVSKFLRDVAAMYLDPETGLAGLLVDEFNSSPEFVAGQRRGQEDAYHILQGVADHFEERERVSDGG